MMNLCCIANMIQCVLYKIMSLRGIDLLEYCLFRNCSIMALCLYLLYVQDRNPFTAGQEMSSEEKKMLLGRAALGYTATLMINACLSFVPFSLLVIIYQTSPFWTSILSYKFNGEPLYMVEMCGMAFCFVAVCFITFSEKGSQNELLTGQTGHVDDDILEKMQKHESVFIKIGGILMILLSALCTSGAAVISRTLKDVPYSIVLFYHSLFGIFVSFVILASLVIFTNRPLYFLEFTPFDNSLLFLATVMDTVGIMTQTIAFQSGNASFVSLISFVNIIYALFADFLFFDEPINMTQVCSALAIIVVCFGVGLEKIRLNKLKRNLEKAIELEKH